MRSRFGLACRLDYYDAPELQQIIERSAKILNIEIEPNGAAEIAGRCRGTPRIANNLLCWSRDYAQVKSNNIVSSQNASLALEMLNIDDNGLDEMDNRILETIIYNFNGGPVGLKNISVSVSEDEGTIEEVYEPFLIQEGFMLRTPKGRMATPKAWRKLGLKPKSKGAQPDLF